METRGAAPSAVCPRCGATAPPSDAPLITCASCKLGFDPRSEPVARPHRPERKEYQPAPPGFLIRREPGEWTVMWSFERWKGLGALVLGGVCAAMTIGNLSTPGERWYHLAALGAAAVVMLYLGVAWTFGHVVVRIDGRQLYRRREPLRFGRQLWIGRGEIEKVDMKRPEGRETWWTVFVVTPRGRITLAEFDEGAGGAQEAATCLFEVVTEALDEIEAG